MVRAHTTVFCDGSLPLSQFQGRYPFLALNLGRSPEVKGLSAPVTHDEVTRVFRVNTRTMQANVAAAGVNHFCIVPATLRKAVGKYPFLTQLPGSNEKENPLCTY